MNIVIPKHRFLRSLFLVNDKNTFSWQSEPSEESYILGNNSFPNSIFPVFELLGIESPRLVSESIEKSFSSLGISPLNIPIDAVQSDKKMIENVKSALEYSRAALEDLEQRGYLDTFMKCNETLRRLCRAQIDIDSLKHAIYSKKIKNVSVAKGFYPKRDGFLEVAEYSNTRTLTGRTTVISGPQILTAPNRSENI